MSVIQFENFLRFEKRYSQHTVLAYNSDLEQFTDFLNQFYPETPVENAGTLEVRSWMVSLMEAGTDPSTIHRKISTLRSYFKYLLKEGIIASNPLVKIQLPKKAKKLPVYIPEQKMNHLLDHNFFEDSLSGRRDRLLIELFYCSGIRLSEFLNLREGNLDWENSQIKVLGKRNKERIIPVPPYVLIHLKDYLTEKKNTFPRSPVSNLKEEDLNNPFLFLTDQGTPIYPKWIYRKVTQFLSLVTTVQKRSPHILRHSFATHLLNNGADINAIKELLGHASLAATQVYTHNSTDRLKSIYNQAHPKA